MTQKQNLLCGSVPKKLIAFALPLLLANILQSFYNVVDMLVVGQFVGETGLAAISNASKLCYIINSICIGMTMGGAVLIAQYKGANNKKGQAETFQMLSMLSLATSILLTVISLAGYQPLFRAYVCPLWSTLIFVDYSCESAESSLSFCRIQCTTPRRTLSLSPCRRSSKAFVRLERTDPNPSGREQPM